MTVLQILMHVLVAFFCSFCFSILFGAPRRLWFYGGLVGAAGWLVYLLLIGLDSGSVIASFGATLTLTACSRLFACWRKAPVIVFLFAGIFLLVPGAGVYYTANYLFSDAFNLGIAKGMETLKIAGAIVLGILSGFSLPMRMFQWAEKLSIKH